MIEEKDWDKLTDIEKIKLNTGLILRNSNMDSLFIVGETSLFFALHNFLLFNRISGILFLIIGSFCFFKWTKLRNKVKKDIKEFFEKKKGLKK
jgi:hypothetical protein